MSPDFFKFYGIDWFGAFALFLGMYFIGEKKKQGFIWGCIGNAAYLIFSYMSGSSGLAFASLILMFLYLRGFLNWNKNP
jgi:hypothetical protein